MEQLISHLYNNTEGGVTQNIVEVASSMIEIIDNEIFGEFPQRIDIAKRLLDIHNITCDELIDLDYDVITECYDHLLGINMKEWDCKTISLLYQYYNEQYKFPTAHELEELLLKVARFESDAYSVESEEKVKIGADISVFIKSINTDTNTDICCQLCCKNINVGEYYHLPCGHHAHSKEEDCEDSTIKLWFDENVQCPLCRYDMRESDAPEIR